MTTEQTAQLAAWESTTVRNLAPLLSDADAASLWEAIGKNRETPNAETFGTAARALVVASHQSAIIEQSIISLRVLVSSFAAQPAQE